MGEATGPTGCGGCGQQPLEDKLKSLGIMNYLRAKTSGRIPQEVADARFRTCSQLCEEKELTPNGTPTEQKLFREINGVFYCGEPWVRMPYRSEKASGCGCDLKDKTAWHESACPRGLWAASVTFRHPQADQLEGAISSET
jgi:hypothetical protein